MDLTTDKMSNDNNIQLTAITAKLTALSTRLDDLTPVMREIAEMLKTDVEEAFEFKHNPSTHQKWKNLDPAYQQQRIKQGKWGGEYDILRRDGELSDEIKSDYGSKFAKVGTNTKYAPVHQFGYANRNVPARAFLPIEGLHPDKATEILEFLDSELAKTLSI